MPNYNAGIVNVGDPGAVIDSTIPSRRLFNFSDRVAELAPDESPFFVYLSKVAKVPTDDPQFRFLEDRTKVSMTDRSFLLNGSHSIPAAGSSLSYTVDSSSASVDWLIKGMVFAVEYTENDSPESIIVRIESGVTDNGSTSSFVGKTISSVDGAETGAGGSKCTVIGTSYAEGSGSPDVWSEELDNGYGYTQIFKTACEMSNTARATRYRGYADEWQRIWNLKLREHKIDIERAMLFGQKASQSGIQYSEGICGHVIKNGTSVVNDDALTYSSGAPYFRSAQQSELTYDRLLSDFEVIYDPARGGSQQKLALASLPVITFFNKLGADFFVNRSIMSCTSTAVNDVSALKYNIQEKEGSFGHKIMMVDTIHGSMALVKEPLFRGFASGFLQLVDLDHVSYRPLVGNGVNRDTHIISNVQSSDEDLRKDMILTEAGLEVSLPETHYLLNLEGV